MSETPAEEPIPDPAEELNDALIGFTGCIDNALEDICSVGWTIGEAYVPFDPDSDSTCEEDGAVCSQAWVRVTDITPTGTTEAWGGDDCSVELLIGLEVGILRCIEIPEKGEAPTAMDVLVAAAQSMTDMQTIFCAAMGCEVWGSLEVGSWTPSGPLGGQYGGIWTFTASL